MRLVFTICLSLALSLGNAVCAAQNGSTQAPKAVIWTDPGDIRSRNLFYGIGGEDRVPRQPLKYESEDRGGTSPKFEVKDSNDEKWKAKLGPEAQPEIVASRLLWAVGYSANENYYFDHVKVMDIAGQQKRGKEFVDQDNTVHSVRLQRHPPHEKKKGKWSWQNNPLKGTREFNGLRVMMALLSNWDLKDDNNAIYEDTHDPGRLVYGVSDVGASFGTSGKSFTNGTSKNNLDAYRRHKFISKVKEDRVDFNFPTHPSFIYYFPLFEFPFVVQEMRHRWVGRDIPRQDVRWIAGLLSQLSHEQIRDAFRAAGYGGAALDNFTAAVEARIAALSKL